jgi:hypothetical protein
MPPKGRPGTVRWALGTLKARAPEEVCVVRRCLLWEEAVKA